MHHPHIVPVLGVDTDTFTDFICSVSPWMGYGNIEQYSRKNPSYVETRDFARLV
jgi:hypothetical protein